MKKIIIGIVSLGLLIIASVAFFMLNTNKEKAAVVNGEDILLSDFENLKSQFIAQQGVDFENMDEAAKQQVETMVLDMLISQKLIEQEAVAADITVTDDEVNTQFDAIKSQFADDEAFAELLKTENLSEEKVKEQLKKDLLIQKYIAQQFNLDEITVSEQEIVSEYELISATQEIGEFADVRADLEQYVKGKKQQELVEQFVEELKTSADIDIRI